MERVATVLRDADRTSFRVVCQPERLVVAETERLVARLREAGVPVGGLVVNRVLTDIDESCDRCRAQRADQQAVLADIESTFPDLPITELPDRTGRDDGRATLEGLAEVLSPA
jgi:arsenite-transporting ATPase